jgi:hypothetical protein
MSEPRYRRNADLRREIAYAVGSDPSRYETGRDRCLLKHEVVAVGTQVTDRSQAALQRLSLAELYPLICQAVDEPYNGNAGNQWRLNRPALLAIHDALDATDPTDDPLAGPPATAQRAECVGDLDPDTIVLRFPNSNTVHLPGGHCSQLTRETGHESQDKRAATLFDDAEICADCRDEQFRGTDTCHLPTQREVPGDD